MTSTEIAAGSKIILGTTEAAAMYVGSTLLWQKVQSSGGDISDYVLNGLIFHLDGINKGNNGDWLDLIGNIVLNLVGSTSYPTLNGYYFDGNSSSYLQSQDLYWSNNSDITVEVCYKEIDTDKYYYVFGFRGDSDSKHPIFYIDGSSITWSQGDYVYDASTISTNTEYTISLNSDSGIVNGSSINRRNSTDYWDYNSTNVIRVGLAVMGGASNHPFKGYIYSIRVYNRKLTQQELLQNQSVDNIRFNLGLFSNNVSYSDNNTTLS